MKIGDTIELLADNIAKIRVAEFYYSIYQADLILAKEKRTGINLLIKDNFESKSLHFIQKAQSEYIRELITDFNFFSRYIQSSMEINEIDIQFLRNKLASFFRMIMPSLSTMVFLRKSIIQKENEPSNWFRKAYLTMSIGGTVGFFIPCLFGFGVIPGIVIPACMTWHKIKNEKEKFIKEKTQEYSENCQIVIDIMKTNIKEAYLIYKQFIINIYKDRLLIIHKELDDVGQDSARIVAQYLDLELVAVRAKLQTNLAEREITLNVAINQIYEWVSDTNKNKPSQLPILKPFRT